LADFSNEPAALFTLGDGYARQFDQLARQRADYSADGFPKMRSNIFTELATAGKLRAAGLAKTFTRGLKDWPEQRDPGKELLLSRARPDVLSLASTAAVAPVPFTVALLRQMIPADPADASAVRQEVETLMATLWLRRQEWSTDPRQAEAVVAVWRRAAALYRGVAYYGGYYIRFRFARAASAWLAGLSTSGRARGGKFARDGRRRHVDGLRAEARGSDRSRRWYPQQRSGRPGSDARRRLARDLRQ
jgi:hypothetical protein